MIRLLQPEVVLGHDPWKRYRLHPDHRHAGLLACEGIVAARDPHFFPEQGLAHHRPCALLLWEADEPDHAEDVTAFVDGQAGRPRGPRQPVRVDDEGHRRARRWRRSAGGSATASPSTAAGSAWPRPSCSS